MEGKNKIESPCNDMCLLDADTNMCKECFRTIDEIIDWYSLSDSEKKIIISRIGKRKNDYLK